MHYIVLDLEWDSAYHKQHKRFINQILQIGAVKLNEEFSIVDTFEKTIKSSFSDKVTSRFSGLTGITAEKMLDGIPFETAVDCYNEWAGTDTVTMTWSDSDLYTILLNEELLLKGGRRLHIEKYLDLQKYIQNEMRLLSGEAMNNQIALGAAAEMLGIKTETFELHTAKDDSLVCAAMLKKHYNAERFPHFVADTQNPEFYKRLTFKPYPISDLRDKDVDHEQLKFYCEKCGTKMQRTSRWRYRNRWFIAGFCCKKCEMNFNGQVSFKKMYDTVKVNRKIREAKPPEAQPASAGV